MNYTGVGLHMKGGPSISVDFCVRKVNQNSTKASLISIISLGLYLWTPLKRKCMRWEGGGPEGYAMVGIKEKGSKITFHRSMESCSSP